MATIYYVHTIILYTFLKLLLLLLLLFQQCIHSNCILTDGKKRLEGCSFLVIGAVAQQPQVSNCYGNSPRVWTAVSIKVIVVS